MGKSDTPPNPQDFYTNGFGADFTEFINSLNPDFKCPFCQNDSFSIASYFDSDGQNVPTFAKLQYKNRKFTDKGESFGLPILHLTCETCGHLSLFDADVYSKWKKQKNEQN